LKAAKRRSKPVKVLLIALAVMAAIAGSLIPERLLVTATASLDKRVFWKADVTEIRKGDYVVFWWPFTDGSWELAVKKVACVRGEKLKSDDNRDFFCGDEHLGRAKQRSLKGEEIEMFRYNGVVPEGKLFAVGDSRDSYDSKYFGFIEEKSVVMKAVPIL